MSLKTQVVVGGGVTFLADEHFYGSESDEMEGNKMEKTNLQDH